ncbi:MAG: hypothetical protein ACE5IZ_08560 [Dehalococcoidia bacterium]
MLKRNRAESRQGPHLRDTARTQKRYDRCCSQPSRAFWVDGPGGQARCSGKVTAALQA